jgi:hypothetical protein
MTEAQRRALASADAAPAPPAPESVASGGTIVPQIPFALVADAGKTPIARLDVTLRVDGLDLVLDGAQTCREGNRRMVGRESGGALGSFDEKALLTCLTVVRASRPEARLVALVGRAGPAVPTTYLDALSAALRRGGVFDVVVAP